MGMAVSQDLTFAVTVSADHLVGKYKLSVSLLRFCQSFADSNISRIKLVIQSVVLFIQRNIRAMEPLHFAKTVAFAQSRAGTASMFLKMG